MLLANAFPTPPPANEFLLSLFADLHTVHFTFFGNNVTWQMMLLNGRLLLWEVKDSHAPITNFQKCHMDLQPTHNGFSEQYCDQDSMIRTHYYNQDRRRI